MQIIFKVKNIYAYIMGICQSNNMYKPLYINNFDDLKLFSFEGLITKCKVVDVNDGDTITIVFYHQNNPLKVKFRLYGYNSPEMKPKKDLQNRDNEIKKAILAKNRLEELILNKVVWVKFDKNEKYGRTMGIIYNDSDIFIDDYNKSINQQMISENHGKIYFGGTKM